MHHSRLVGGLAALAVLLTLSLAPVALATTSSGLASATNALPPATNGQPAATNALPPATSGQSAATSSLPPANPGANTLAQKCLGDPFKNGGTSTAGFDMPGLTTWIYARVGVWLPRDMAGQAARGKTLTRDQLKPGDLVFYGTDFHHVGVYIGGSKMVNASRAAGVVKESTIFWSRHVSLRRYDARTGINVVREAKKYLGVPYVWGGASPSGFDCSGLTMYVYAKFGKVLAHGATDQQKASRKIALANVRPGDLVFSGNASFSYHVGIAIGGGQMIDAPHTGEVVKIEPILPTAWTGGRFLPVH